MYNPLSDFEDIPKFKFKKWGFMGIQRKNHN